MERDLNVTDLELVEKVKSGDRSAFSELVKRHQRSVLRLSLRFVKDMDTAEDVTQDAFIKAYEKLASFEARASFKHSTSNSLSINSVISYRDLLYENTRFYILADHH